MRNCLSIEFRRKKNEKIERSFFFLKYIDPLAGFFDNDSILELKKSTS